VESHGLAVANPTNMIQLCENPAHWCLVDSGDLVDFIPVWNQLLNELDRHQVAETREGPVQRLLKLVEISENSL
jgi:hypothetical protein